MNNRTPETFNMNRLVRVEGRGNWLSIDVDTLRDGGWWLPASGIKAIEKLLQAHGIHYKNYDGIGERSFLVRGVPKEKMDGLRAGLCQILARYRCECAARADIERART